MRRQLVRKNGDEDEVVYAKHDFHHHKRGQGSPDGGIGKYREYIGHGIFFAETNAKLRSEEHTSELQSLMRISYAVFCLKKKKQDTTKTQKHMSMSEEINKRKSKN